MQDMKAIANDLMCALAQLRPPVDPKFRGPASQEAIRQAESQLNVALEDELIQFLFCFDGQEPESHGFLGDPIVPQIRFGPDPVHFSGWGWLLGIERIVEFTLLYRELFEENQEEKYECHGPAHFHGDYIQLMGADNATGIAIDLRPLPGWRGWTDRRDQ